MKTYGLIGYRLGHSFSKGFFKEKFKKEELTDYEYLNFELDRIDDFPDIFKKNDHIAGLNCTIPYKQAIIPFLDKIDDQAAEVGAVNTIKVIRLNNQFKLKGFNTDCYGFEHSILPMLKSRHRKTLILGTGGASKAIKYVLNRNKIEYLSATTKDKLGDNELSYHQIDKALLEDHLIVINATPLGTYPNVDNCPAIPYEFLTPDHVLYDLVYNPEETLFLKKGKAKGAITKNGLEMLHLQAEKAWKIWNE